MKYNDGEVFDAKILSHRLRVINDKVVVELVCEGPEGECRPVIFVTRESANMARAQLRLCGFDADSEDLGVLDDETERLAGKTIQVEASEYNNRMTFRVKLPDRPSKKAVSNASAVLRGKSRGVVNASGESLSEEDIPF